MYTQLRSRFMRGTPTLHDLSLVVIPKYHIAFQFAMQDHCTADVREPGEIQLEKNLFYSILGASQLWRNSTSRQIWRDIRAVWCSTPLLCVVCFVGPHKKMWCSVMQFVAVCCN